MKTLIAATLTIGAPLVVPFVTAAITRSLPLAAVLSALFFTALFLALLALRMASARKLAIAALAAVLLASFAWFVFDDATQIKNQYISDGETLMRALKNLISPEGLDITLGLAVVVLLPLIISALIARPRHAV